MEKQFIIDRLNEYLEVWYRRNYLEYSIALSKTLDGKLYTFENWEKELRVVDEYIESRYN